ncbi:MAG: hypothetical protein COT28_01630 [Methylobacterium sp. CG08_land_8_20_14_0_20_71_15]|nr:MAG: hypothetical protein COT56_07310 [Methylobacterium sp. CG09_land_8_20_14_0_10_71_15]PIU16143.1 MAG: hypothetical protein COT28_01630 [Methylobacterium sp. CG08_land_8_20_14_0_20_71_15]GBU18049.1 hypothetical protein AwMethylo_22640 [Methylobacterium sp.]
MTAVAVVDLQQARDARAGASFEAYAAALKQAQASGNIVDMAAAVRAFDDFMRRAGLSEKHRREMLG